jgi:hypothetical protein
MRLNLPVYVWEIFGFGLAARYFIVHILARNVAARNRRGDYLTILFKNHALWFLL